MLKPEYFRRNHDYLCPGPCFTTAICHCRKNFSQWQRSFQWKLHYHWLKFLWQHHVTVVIQGPGYARGQGINSKGIKHVGPTGIDLPQRGISNACAFSMWRNYAKYNQAWECAFQRNPGYWLNIKVVFPRYGDSHVKDKMVMRPLTWGSLYW